MTWMTRAMENRFSRDKVPLQKTAQSAFTGVPGEIRENEERLFQEEFDNAIDIPESWVVKLMGGHGSNPRLHISDLGQSFVIKIDKRQASEMMQSLQEERGLTSNATPIRRQRT